MAQWNTGDIITAEKLNSASVFVVGVSKADFDTVVCDKTWNEINDAIGMVVFKETTDQVINYKYLVDIYIENGEFRLTDTDNNYYSCEDPDDYPFYIEDR